MFDLEDIEYNRSKFAEMMIPFFPILNNLSKLTLLSTYLKMGEEVGELAQAMGKDSGLNGEEIDPNIDPIEIRKKIAKELIDVIQVCMTYLYKFEEENKDIDMDKMLAEHYHKIVHIKKYAKEKKDTIPERHLKFFSNMTKARAEDILSEGEIETMLLDINSEKDQSNSGPMSQEKIDELLAIVSTPSEREKNCTCHEFNIDEEIVPHLNYAGERKHKRLAQKEINNILVEAAALLAKDFNKGFISDKEIFENPLYALREILRRINNIEKEGDKNAI